MSLQEDKKHATQTPKPAHCGCGKCSDNSKLKCRGCALCPISTHAAIKSINNTLLCSKAAAQWHAVLTSCPQRHRQFGTWMQLHMSTRAPHNPSVADSKKGVLVKYSLTALGTSQLQS